MKPLEFVLLASLMLMNLMLYTQVRVRPRWAHLLPSGSLLLLCLHLLLEGFRWQLLLAYLMVTFIFLATLRNIRYYRQPWLLWQLDDRKFLRLAGAGLSLLLLLDTVFLLWVAPLFKMPDPGGTYPIGTTFYYFSDPQREELFTPDPDDHRSVSAQAWYPAIVVKGCRQQPYLEAALIISPVIARFLSMPFFAFSHLKHINTSACRDSPEAEGRFPVLIFSHAYDGNIAQNTVLMEALASHGYVVFSVGHAYESPFIYDADGAPILFDPANAARQARLGEMSDPEVEQIKALILSASQTGMQARYYHRLFALNPRLQQSVHIWADDIAYFADQLDAINRRDAILAGRMSLDAIGVLGHSLGGAAAGQFCVQDSRCKAGANLDGFQYGDLLEKNLGVPFMFLYSALPATWNSKVNDCFYQHVENAAYSLVIGGTAHETFSDMPLYFRADLLRPELKLIKPQRFASILQAYLLAFFDRHLKGIQAPLLNGPSSEYPEVQFEHHQPPG